MSKDFIRKNIDKELLDLCIGNISIEHKNRIFCYWNDSKISLRYKANEILLEKIFSNDDNTSKDIVSQKVSLLDYTYSTNLKEGYNDMVDNIISIEGGFNNKVNSVNLDDRLSLIDRMSVHSNNSKSGRKRTLSFSTKYCLMYSKHAKEEKYNFPIYDNNVYKMIYYINKRDSFYSTDYIKKNDYKVYCNAIDALIDYLEKKEGVKLSYIEIDKYLWQWSKIIINSMLQISKNLDSGKRIDDDGNEIKSNKILEYFLQNMFN